MKKRLFFIFIFVLILSFFLLNHEVKADTYYYHKDGTYNELMKNLSLPDDLNQNTHYMIVLAEPSYKDPYFMLYYTNDADFSHFLRGGRGWFDVANTSGGYCNILLRDCNMSDYSWEDSKTWGWLTGGSVLFSTDPIFLDDGTEYIPGFYYELNYFEEYNMYEFVTNFFDMSSKNNLKCQISSDGINYVDAIISEDEISNQFLFYYDIYKNGTYYVRLTQLDTNTVQEVSFTISNLKEVSTSLNLHLSTTEPTTDPIYILSNKYYYEGNYDASKDFLNNYDIDIAYGLESPYEYSPFSIEGTDDNGTFRQYQYKIVINGIYQARILDLNTGEISYQTFNVQNIGVKNKYGDDIYYNNYNENGEFDPSPILFLDYIDTTTVRIRTQPFIFNELMYLECYFSSDGENYKKINNVYKYSVDTGNSSYDYNTGEKQNIQDLYYFYYDVQSDGIYYFKFYNIDFKKYTVGSIEVNIGKFLSDNINNIDKYPDKFVLWANQHFGVLTYPFTFVINFFGRINNIDYSEPVIHIPELKDPLYGNKILDATDFNFNSILSNSVIKTTYNIYLVSVDFILIVLFVSLCKNVFSEVFSK